MTLQHSQRLRKDLSLLNVYAISLGATLSSGFFLLPGLAAAEAGSGVVLAYLIALLPLIPGILSKVELSTAMPRAGGEYYFIDRAVGPFLGTVAGLGTWLALILKVAFALVGIGAYLTLLWDAVPITWVAMVFALAFGLLNLIGTKRTGGLQVLLVGALLALLLWFIVRGSTQVQLANVAGLFDRGPGAILSATGIVCVSFIGLTKVASVSEEVKDPERNLPVGMFLSVTTASVIYIVGTFVMVGVLGVPRMSESPTGGPMLTPVSETAAAFAGVWGSRVMTAAAILAFFSVANAGILSASRYPLAMSRDRLMPDFFQKLGRFGTPTMAIATTVGLIMLSLLVLDPLRIAKLAGAFQLLLFAFNCLSVLVMRESRIESYDPGYRAPFYPWLQIVGIAAPLVLIAELGLMPMFFTIGLVTVGMAWYFLYGQRRVTRRGAIHHVFNRLGHGRPGELDRELRSILKEKGLRRGDPFDEIVVRASVFEADEDEEFPVIVERAAGLLAERLSCPLDPLVRGFMEGTRTGATPVTGGVALPHMRLPGLETPKMVLVRSAQGIQIDLGDVFGETHVSGATHAIFFLVSPDADPGQHLRLLAQLASRVDEGEFLEEWEAAADEQELKEVLLRHERYVALTLAEDSATRSLVGRAIRDLDLPEGALVAVIRRREETIVPRGRTILEAGDRMTVIGNEREIRELYDRYVREP